MSARLVHLYSVIQLDLVWATRALAAVTIQAHGESRPPSVVEAAAQQSQQLMVCDEMGSVTVAFRNKRPTYRTTDSFVEPISVSQLRIRCVMQSLVAHLAS